MSDFIPYLSDVFVTFGSIQSRKMFGGYGIYHQGVMFGLVAEDTLYLKADDNTATQFVAQGLPPFTYQKGDKTFNLSYYQAPEAIYDDPEAAATWARLAFEVAQAAKARKPPKRRKKAV